MKKTLLLLAAITLSTGCVPKLKTPSPDRFNISNYAVDTSNTTDITGTWIIVTKNATIITEHDNGSGHVETYTQKVIGGRRICTITAMDPELIEFCGSLASLNGNKLQVDGITYTITDNNSQMTATIDQTIVDDVLVAPGIVTTTLSGTYYARKIAPLNHSFGLMAVNDETSNVKAFTEEVIKHTSVMDGNVESSSTERRYYVENFDLHYIEASVTDADINNTALLANSPSYYFFDPHYDGTATFSVTRTSSQQFSATCGGYDDNTNESFTCSVNVDI